MTEDAVAAFVGKKKDWYQKFQKWQGDVGWSQVLRILAGMRMNLESVRNHMSSAPAVTPKDAAEDAAKVEAYNRKQREMRLARETRRGASKRKRDDRTMKEFGAFVLAAAAACHLRCVPMVVGAMVGRAAATHRLQEQLPPPWLGMEVCDWKGIQVQRVVNGSPAAMAGILPGDTILEINNETVTAPRWIRSSLEKLGVGNSIALLILRNGTRKEVLAAIGARPADDLPPGQTVYIPALQAISVPRGDPRADLECRENLCQAWISPCEPVELQAQSPGRVIAKLGQETVIFEGRFQGRLYLDKDRCRADAEGRCGLVI